MSDETLRRNGGPEAVLIAGPTASGKSALALRLARRFGGEVVNADSMQVYAGLRILTARPSEAEMEGVTHHLYGHRDPAAPYSVGDWLREVEPLLSDLRARGRVPVFCGGTGLYFRALTQGLDEWPPVPAPVREKWRGRMAAEGPQALHAVLADLDGAAAAMLRPSDPQRITRALELIEAGGGAPLAGLRRRSAEPLLAESARLAFVLAPPRPVLRTRIALRFDAMLAAGAMEEALAFAEKEPAAEGLAGKAIGLDELLAAHRGEIALEEARRRAVDRSRQYAKRQETWFRNQMGPHWQRLADASLWSEGEPGEPERPARG